MFVNNPSTGEDEGKMKILHGRNGHSFVINISSWRAVGESLKFYQALTLKKRVMKAVLHLGLWGLGLLTKCNVRNAKSKVRKCGSSDVGSSSAQVLGTKCEGLDSVKAVTGDGKLRVAPGEIWGKEVLSAAEINEFLCGVVGRVDFNFELDGDCSVLVSPTRDKIIVNHHGKYFHKFAFGESVKSVGNEAKIYALLSDEYKNFATSHIADLEQGEGFVSFKMSHTEGLRVVSELSTAELSQALVEFFQAGGVRVAPLTKVVEALRARCEVLSVKCKELDSVESVSGERCTDDVRNAKCNMQDAKCYVSENTNNPFVNSVFFEVSLRSLSVVKRLDEIDQRLTNDELPIGLVHRDFKVWNVMKSDVLFIYDFEDTVTDGLPMSDLLNYYIDPMIRSKGVDGVKEFLENDERKSVFDCYCKALNCKVGVKTLIELHLIERTIFWAEKGQIEASNQYLKLLQAVSDVR